MTAEAAEVYRLVLAIVGVGIVISAAEYWVEAEAFEASGPFAWRVLGIRDSVPGGLLAVVGRMPAASTLRALLVIRLVGLVAALLAMPGTPVFAFGLATLVVTDLALHWRRTSFGADGADQMTTIVLLTMLVCAGLTPTRIASEAGLWFIAGQGCLSYLAAGVAKLASPTWRSGKAVALIFNTGAYGTPALARLLWERPWLSAGLSWSAMMAETLFILTLLLPEPWRWAFLGWGILFHLSCAVVMGLNTFFWAFVSTYPAIIFLAAQLSPAVGRLVQP